MSHSPCYTQISLIPPFNIVHETDLIFVPNFIYFLMRTKVSPSISNFVEKYCRHNTKWKDIRICTDMNELQEMVGLNQFDIVSSGHPFPKKVLREL